MRRYDDIDDPDYCCHNLGTSDGLAGSYEKDIRDLEKKLAAARVEAHQLRKAKAENDERWQSAIQLAIGFCVDFRESVSDWARFPQVGVLFAKLSAVASSTDAAWAARTAVVCAVCGSDRCDCGCVTGMADLDPAAAARAEADKWRAVVYEYVNARPAHHRADHECELCTALAAYKGTNGDG